MAANRIPRSKSSLKPLYSVLFVDEKGCITVPQGSIKSEIVGEKAFGLSCLPKSWTLPFIVISDRLLINYRNCSSSQRQLVIKNWSKKIITAVLSAGINKSDHIIVRSSGHLEGLKERGKFYSSAGTVGNLLQVIVDCLEKIITDKELKDHKIPLIIQKCVIPSSAKGHLTNERRCYKEDRDWLGEFEGINTRLVNKFFKINLRNWRRKVTAKTDKSIRCNLIEHIGKALETPAAWGYAQHLRLHFEWVWDGEIVYIVQVDQEAIAEGVDPTAVYNSKFSKPSFIPKCLKEIDQTHADKYNKIANVFTYLKLGLPVTNLYVLDDQTVIRNLASGKVPKDLVDDLSTLITRPLVIRMDIATKDMRRSQLLPRIDVREIKKAIQWLKKESKAKNKAKEKVVFIFHNFVPAISSAFALATPDERKVQIEALWGLPEGLYYYAHDKYIVDTHRQSARDLQKDNVSEFDVESRPYFKRYFVIPDQKGQWTTQIIKQPYDWHPSIQKTEWVKEIAFESRRIAMEEGKALSIMWFVNVPEEVCSRPIFPWHHEVYDPLKMKRALTERTKTDLDKTITIKTKADLAILKKEAKQSQSHVRRIQIQPIEHDLLRNKDMLQEIGGLAKKIEATILLEGGQLSHVYYQLMQTQAIVQVLHPFESSDHKQDFNKLVRDKIPSNVEQGGEEVSKAKLSGEFLLRALREKLIEEAFEVLDASDKDSILGELADVNEIIDAILYHSGLTRENLKQKQDKKREKAGGFKEGLVLLETRNPLPTKKVDNQQILFSDFDKKKGFIPIDERTIAEIGYKIKKWSDRRGHQSETEEILDLIVPSVRNNWAVDTSEITLGSGTVLRVKITGERMASKSKIKLSVFFPKVSQK